jgi:Flp pilus assembly protein CpaB
MEMEYKDPSKRGRWVILLGILLAVGAGGAAFYLINQAQQQAGQSGLKTMTAVVAARAIPARKPIEADDVVVRSDIPIDGTNAEAPCPTRPRSWAGSSRSRSSRASSDDQPPGVDGRRPVLVLAPDETVAPESEPCGRSRSSPRTTVRWAAC